jgi:hypothetical protein
LLRAHILSSRPFRAAKWFSSCRSAGSKGLSVGSLFAAGRAIPATKTAVLSAVVDLLENESQHAPALSEAPLNGFARAYLEDIACDMTARGTTQRGGQEARQLVRTTSKRLQETGQIVTLPEPGAILQELTAHHILDVTAYPSETLSFAHQQFQELFASQRLVRSLYEALRKTQALKAFTRTFLNEPAWEEPLLMSAEQLRESPEEDAAEAGGAMVLETLKVDPVFASELSNLSGSRVWDRVRVTEAISRVLAERFYEAPNGQEMARIVTLATTSLRRCRHSVGLRSPIAQINSGRIGNGMMNRLLDPQMDLSPGRCCRPRGR